MSAYHFSNAERYAVFTVHRERCWLCEQPVALDECQVDHVIPERLDRCKELSAILRNFGLSPDFDLNSYANWMPAHGNCNRQKSGRVFSATPIIQHRLELAAERAPRAKELAEKFGTDRRISRSLQELKVAIDQGTLSETHKLEIINLISTLHEENRPADTKGHPLFIAPWLEVVGVRDGFHLLRGPGGHVGIRPIGKNLHPSWDCPHCGETGWNGVRCIICGRMDDGD